MEGLIPMVYRAIKRNRERSRYECLSSSTARTYNISDFYPTGSQTRSPRHFHLAAPPPSNDMVNREPFARGGVHGGRHHRSRSSAADYSFGKSFGHKDDMPMPRKQRMVRFRSTRMLSCLTGT